MMLTKLGHPKKSGEDEGIPENRRKKARKRERIPLATERIL